MKRAGAFLWKPNELMPGKGRREQKKKRDNAFGGLIFIIAQ